MVWVYSIGEDPKITVSIDFPIQSWRLSILQVWRKSLSCRCCYFGSREPGEWLATTLEWTETTTWEMSDLSHPHYTPRPVPLLLIRVPSRPLPSESKEPEEWESTTLELTETTNWEMSDLSPPHDTPRPAPLLRGRVLPWPLPSREWNEEPYDVVA